MATMVEAQTRSGLIRSFADLGREDVAFAGGKGANLGELTRGGFSVPAGFVVGAPAYDLFVTVGGLRDRIAERLAGVNVDDPEALRRAADEVRAMVAAEPVPGPSSEEVDTYAELAVEAVSVRSSATAEDTEAASFAGMNETFLNMRGADAVVDAVRRCWASLFGARTIFYRAKRGFGQADMDIAVIVQRQLEVDARRRDVHASTRRPATDDHLVIEGAFGLGEAVVIGSVSPDRYVVDKATLAILAREVQPKDSTIEPRDGRGHRHREVEPDEALRPASPTTRRRLAGPDWRIERALRLAAGHRVGVRPGRRRRGCSSRGRSPPSAARDGDAGRLAGRPFWCAGSARRPALRAGRSACSARSPTPAGSHDGDVLVTQMTAPDWVPLMRRAAAIVTDSGGMTCHAAIVSRELGIPCVVGTRRRRPKRLRDGEVVTVDATRGVVVEGPSRRCPRCRRRLRPRAASAPAPATGDEAAASTSPSPRRSQRAAALDVDGVGLLRAELMVIEALEGMHPRLLLEQGRGDEFVERDGRGARRRSPRGSRRGRSRTGRSTSARTSSAGCEGGERFEPEEANPMIGVPRRAALHRASRTSSRSSSTRSAGSGTRATRTCT